MPRCAGQARNPQYSQIFTKWVGIKDFEASPTGIWTSKPARIDPEGSRGRNLTFFEWKIYIGEKLNFLKNLKIAAMVPFEAFGPGI